MKLDETLNIMVHDGVYEPAEDSYLLLDALDIEPGMDVLEVGTGTGIIALHCAKAGARVLATDISASATRNARYNSINNSIPIGIIRADILAGIRKKFDLILFNPPYLKRDGSDILPESVQVQITGGQSGSEITIRFLKQAQSLLKDEGAIYLLTSSESEERIIEHAVNQFDITKVREEKLFFERLCVYILQMGNDHTQE